MVSSHPAVLAGAREAVAPLLDSDRRRILVGITGPPAAGKSTLATTLAHSLRTDYGGKAAIAIPMDGFHLANAELARLGLANRKGAPETFDAAGFVPIERANREQSFPALERATRALIDGHSFLIFPEGTRSRTGELLPFKKGGFVMAIGAQVPIVPVAVSGGRDAMRKGSSIIWPVTVTVVFGAPIPTAGRTADDRDALIAAVRGAIAAQMPRA